MTYKKKQMRKSMISELMEIVADLAVVIVLILLVLFGLHIL